MASCAEMAKVWVARSTSSAVASPDEDGDAVGEAPGVPDSEAVGEAPGVPGSEAVGEAFVVSASTDVSTVVGSELSTAEGAASVGASFVIAGLQAVVARHAAAARAINCRRMSFSSMCGSVTNHHRWW